MTHFSTMQDLRSSLFSLARDGKMRHKFAVKTKKE